MQPIPETYKNAGYSFSLHSRENDIAVYSSDCPTVWEIHIIKTSKASTVMFGEKEFQYPDREVLATNSTWGQYGFSAQSEREALNIRSELYSKRLEAQNKKK